MYYGVCVDVVYCRQVAQVRGCCVCVCVGGGEVVLQCEGVLYCRHVERWQISDCRWWEGSECTTVCEDVLQCVGMYYSV